MQAKQTKDLRPKTGGNVDKTQTIEKVARDMRTGRETSRSAATYTTGAKKASKGGPTSVSALKAGANQFRQGLATSVRNDNPVAGLSMSKGANTAKAVATGAAAGAKTAQAMTNQLLSKQYENSQKKSSRYENHAQAKPKKRG